MSTRELAWESEMTHARIEYAYSLAQKMLDARNEDWVNPGMRAVRRGDAKLLRALELMAESTNTLQERQIGQLMRSTSAKFGETRGTTEHQLCREAYTLAQNYQLDKDGTDRRVHFQWIYGAAAWLCGYTW